MVQVDRPPAWLRPRAVRASSGMARSVPASYVALVRRELTWLVLVCMAVWVLESPVLWPWTATEPIAAVAGWVVVAAWLLLLSTQVRGSRAWRQRSRAAVVTSILVAAALLSLPVVAQPGWEAGATLVILGGGVAGALLPRRGAVLVVGVAAVLSIEPTSRLIPRAGETGWPVPFVPVYVLAVGTSMALFRHALERNAARVDADVARRDAADRQRSTVAGVESTLRRYERLLHETVLNTLTAISRGGLGSDRATVRALHERCREAIAVLTGLGAVVDPPDAASDGRPGGSGAGDPGLASVIERIRAEGLPVEITVDALDEVPDPVRRALVTAIREALSNVVRHAGASGASVHVRVQHDRGLAVRAEVRDDGVGFDVDVPTSRFGLARAIRGSLEEVGGTATIDSTPGGGTRVVLEWRERPAEEPDRAWARGVVLPPLATVSIFVAAMVSMAWIEFGHPRVTLTDVALIAVLAVLVAIATPEAPLPWSLVVTVSALGPLFALLSASSGGGLVLVGGWALAAVAALYLVVAAIGPPGAWLLLLVSWLVGEVALVDSFSDVVILVIIGGAVFGRSLRRDALALERSHRRRVAAETALDVARESVSRLRDRYGALEESSAAALLAGIVAGEIDADDPATRRTAGLEESFIRSLMRIDAHADDVRRLASDLAVVARRRDVHLQADLLLPPVPMVVVPDSLAGSCASAVASSAPDTSARFTARLAGTEVLLTLVATIEDGELDRMRALPVPGEFTDPADPADRTLMWEARLPLDESP